jgi:rSAM/selenodomain-associated transferase 1
VNIQCERGIILFVRKPELGKVKTRLAAEVGNEEALEIYNILLAHTKEVVSKVDARVYVFYAEEVVQDDLWTSVAYSKELQVERDLGGRMLVAFQSVLHNCRNVLIIGSDCAQLRPRHLEEAWCKLESSDVVVGPSLDGGYYLLGMKKAHDNLFLDIPWSTDAVANVTRERGTKLELSLEEIEVLSDIDYKEDWDRYGASFILK